MNLEQHIAATFDEPPPIELSATDARGVRSWQRSARRRLWKVMGRLPEQVDLKPRLTDAADAGDHLRHHVYYRTEETFEVSAYLLVPKNIQGPRPAILAISGHVDRAKEEVAGIEHIYPFPTDYGLFYVRQGFVVLCPDNRGFGELSLRPPDPTDCNEVIGRYQLTGRVLQGLRIWDVLRGVDYLASRPEVDTKAIGACGLSLGGELTWHAAALDRRVKAAICFDILRPLKPELKQFSHCPCSYMPGFFNAFRDYDEPAALAAPKPLLLQAASTSYYAQQAREAYQRLKKVYQLLGKPDNLAYEEFPGDHQFFDQGLAVDWFRRWLGEPGG